MLRLNLAQQESYRILLRSIPVIIIDRQQDPLAAHAFREVGAPAASAIPALIAALSDKDPGVGEFAALAMGMIGKSMEGSATKLSVNPLDAEIRSLTKASTALAHPQSSVLTDAQLDVNIALSIVNYLTHEG